MKPFRTYTWCFISLARSDFEVDSEVNFEGASAYFGEQLPALRMCVRALRSLGKPLVQSSDIRCK